MEIPRKKEFLIDLVDTLGLSDDVVRKYTKAGKDCTTREAYVEALQKHFLKERYGSLDSVPQHMWLALKYFPQLATPKNQLKPKSQQDTIWASVWSDSDYIFEEKLDGMRFRWIYVQGEGLHCYTRHIDALEFLPIESTANIICDLDESVLIDAGITSFFLDSELICLGHEYCQLLSSYGVAAETQLAAVSALMHMNAEDSLRIQSEGAALQAFVFDCLMLNGEMLIDKPLFERKKYLIENFPSFEASGLPVSLHKSYKLSLKAKHKMYDRILDMGREGIIAKRVDSPYSPDKRINDWVKVKRTLGQMGDSIAGFITGYKPGKKGSELENYVGSVQVSTNVVLANGEVEERSIAWIKDFPQEIREKLTHYDSEGFPILNPKFLGKVLNVDGQHFSARSRHIVHARISEWRPDLEPFDCTLDEEWINNLVL